MRTNTWLPWWPFPAWVGCPPWAWPSWPPRSRTFVRCRAPWPWMRGSCRSAWCRPAATKISSSLEQPLYQGDKKSLGAGVYLEIFKKTSDDQDESCVPSRVFIIPPPTREISHGYLPRRLRFLSSLRALSLPGSLSLMRVAPKVEKVCFALGRLIPVSVHPENEKNPVSKAPPPLIGWKTGLR